MTRGGEVVSGASSEQSKRSGNPETQWVVWILALYGCIAVPLGIWLNVWLDESYSLFGTSKGLGIVIPHSQNFELQPPVFFLALWFWRQISTAIWYARLFPICAVGAALWIAHLASRRWFPKLPSAWVVLPLAVNPAVIFAATELRPYCLVLFWSMLLLFLYHAAFVEEAPRLKARILYLVAGVLAVYTYYYLGFVLAGGGVALVLWRRWRAAREYALWMALAALLILPQFFVALKHAHELTGEIAEMPGLGTAMVFALTRVFATEVGYFDFAERYRPLWAGLTIGIPLAISVTRIRNWTFSNSAIPIIALFVSFAYVGVAWRIAGEVSFFRHFLVALIPLHFAIVAAIDHLDSPRPVILRSLMALLVVAGVVSSAIHFAPLAKVGDFRRVAAYIEENEQGREPIVMVVSHTEHPFRYYYRGVNDIIPLPEHDPYERYDIDAWAIKDVEQVRKKLADVKPGEHIWVYSDRPPDAGFHGVNLRLDLLEQVLREDYEPVGERDFHMGKVRKFSRK